MVESSAAQQDDGGLHAYSLGKYVQDHEEHTWMSVDTHETIKNTWIDHTIEGPSDWAYNHNRLTTPNQSKITARFKFPGALLTAHKLTRISLIVNYFAGWDSEHASVDIACNGQPIGKKVMVRGEQQGRQTHVIDIPRRMLRFTGN